MDVWKKRVPNAVTSIWVSKLTEPTREEYSRFWCEKISPKPFYWSTHKADLDPARSSSFEKGGYYEWELSANIKEVFDAKSEDGKESIFLNVGGNIGCFFFSQLPTVLQRFPHFEFERNPVNLVSRPEWLASWRSYKDTVLPIAKGVDSEIATLKLYRTSEENPG
jgi:hypothetical protein